MCPNFLKEKDKFILKRWKNNLRKWLGIATAIFCLTPQAELPKKEAFGSAKEFFQSNSLQTDELSWSSESGKIIRFTADEKWEIVLSGKLKSKSDLVIDDKKVSPNAKGEFQFALVLNLREETHELTLRSEKGEIKTYPFTVQLIRDPPKPIRAKIRIDKDKVITKGLLLQGSYPSEHWLKFTWLEPSQKIDPEVVKALAEADRQREKQEREKKEKELAELRKRELAKKEEEEKQRSLAAEAQRALELKARMAVRDPFGWKFDYGLGLLSLDQPGVGKLSSANWSIALGLNQSLSDNLMLNLQGQAFLFPLSVEGARVGPRWLKSTAEISYELIWSESFQLSPTIGVGYQSLSSQEGFGYQAMAGPRLGLLGQFSLGSKQMLKTELSLTALGEPSQYLGLKNTEVGLKTFLEFKNSSGFFSGFYLGGEIMMIRLRLNSGSLNGTVYSGFLGINF